MQISMFVLCVCISCFSLRAEDQKNAIKITFLSWITGSTKISYERALLENQSMEFTASFIGAGYDKYRNNPLGYTLRYGHKFFLNGQRIRKLQGFYLRPELIYCHYKYDMQETGERGTANMAALLASVGYQWNWQRFILDAWLGGGYAIGTLSDTGYHHGFALWDYFGTQHENIAMSFTVKLGYAF